MRKLYRLAKGLILGLYFDLFVKTYKVNEQIFIVPKNLTTLAFRSRFVLHNYESVDEYNFIDIYLDKNSNVLELGGCLGVLSCYINRCLINKEKHVVVEANSELIPVLKENRDLNNSNFIIENCVISNNKYETFYIHELIIGGSLKRETTKAIKVIGKTIAEIERKYDIKFNVLIIDIEGGELSLLIDNKEYLKQINTIFIEIHNFANILHVEEASECERLLKLSGFNKVNSTINNVYQVWSKQ